MAIAFFFPANHGEGDETGAVMCWYRFATTSVVGLALVAD